MAPLDIAVLGGGVSVASLAELLASEPSLRQSTLRLHACRAARLRTITEYCRGSVGDAIEVVATDSPEAAIDGVDLVVNLIRVGGHAARGEDEALEWRGAPGDEGLGPGGVANGCRSLPATRELAAVVHRLAPRAVVLNMAAPLGLTTGAFLDAGLRAVGLCELPLVVADRLSEGGAPEVQYVGSNHLGLHLPRRGGCQDLEHLAAVAGECGLASHATVERLGGVPAPYFHRVIRPDLGRSLGITATAGRADELGSLTADVVVAMESGEPVVVRELLARRPTPWFPRSLVPALVAVATGVPTRLACNVANRVSDDSEPLVSWLPGEMVVELLGEWGRHGFSPEVPQEPGPASIAYLRSVAESEAATWRAAERPSSTARTAAIRAWDEVDAADWAARRGGAAVVTAPRVQG